MQYRVEEYSLDSFELRVGRPEQHVSLRHLGTFVVEGLNIKNISQCKQSGLYHPTESFYNL